MKYIYLILNSVFGFFFLLVGVVFLFASLLPGLCLIAVAALLLPPVRDFVYSKTNKELSVNVRTITILALLIASVFFEKQDLDREEARQTREKAEKVAQLLQADINHFNSNREKIIASVKKSLSDKEYQSVVSQSYKYLASGDNELKQINAQAKKGLKTEKLLTALKNASTKEHRKNRNLYRQLSKMHPDNELYKTKFAFYAAKIKEEHQKQKAAEAKKKQKQKAEKTEKLLAELKSVPTKEYRKNRNLYRQLLKMHPDNELYKTKFAFYAAKIKEEHQKQKAAEDKKKQKQKAAEDKKKRIESQFSGWDGSHRNLERVIKDSMNDPDSYNHVETAYSDRGNYLIVRTTFRGKNAFGAVVKNSVTAKVSLSGRVLEILNQD